MSEKFRPFGLSVHKEHLNNEFFAACREADVKVVFAEQESWHKDPFECLKESYDFFVANDIR